MDEQDDNEPVDNEHLIAGIAHSPRTDLNYKALLAFLKVVELPNQRIMTALANKYLKETPKSKTCIASQVKYCHLLKFISEPTKRDVISWHLNGWTIPTISSWFSLNNVTVRAIVNEQKFLENSITNNGNPTEYHYKVSKEHILAAKHYLKTNHLK